MFEGIQLAIFDMDGLMFDTERYYYQAQLDACMERGYQVNPQKMIDSIGSRSFDLKGFFCGHIPTDLADAGQFLDDAMNQSIQKMCREGVPKKPGIDELTEYLNDRGIPMIIATSTPHDNAVALIKSSGLMKRFAGIITSSEVAHAKPAPDLFQEACRRMHAEPENAIVFEDSRNGAKAAYAASIPYVLVPDMVQPDTEAEEHAAMVARTLNDVLAVMRNEKTRGELK